VLVNTASSVGLPTGLLHLAVDGPGVRHWAQVPELVGVFDAIFFGSLERIVNVVPIDAADLADWAVRLYDEYLRRPDLIRLATWARLERRPAGHLVGDPDRHDDHKLRAIAEAQAAGLVRQGDPFDVMAMVIAMSMAWSPVSNVYAATAQEPPELHEQRRTLLRESVRRAMTADPI
jgi:hypothetical protein